MIWACPEPEPYTIAWLMGLICIVGPFRARYESYVFAATETIHISEANKTMKTGITRFLNTLRDPQPVIVILRPSPTSSGPSDWDSNNPRATIFMRSLQLMWLLLLSFFFSGAVGGNMTYTLFTVWLFVSFLGVSRLISIETVRSYEHLHVVEYDGIEELEAMRKRIGELPKVRVEVREAFKSSIKPIGKNWGECIHLYEWIKKIQDDWKNCIKSYGYEEGQKEAADSVCTHTRKAAYQWLVKGVIPIVFAAGLISSVMIVSMRTRSSGIPFLAAAVAGVVSIINWESSIVLCNCRIERDDENLVESV